jgi:hypothetical protein
MLFTDGVEDDFLDLKTGEVTQGGEAMLEWLMNNSEETINFALGNKLRAFFKERSYDDCTIGLVSFIELSEEAEPPGEEELSQEPEPLGEEERSEEKGIAIDEVPTNEAVCKLPVKQGRVASNVLLWLCLVVTGCVLATLASLL